MKIRMAINNRAYFGVILGKFAIALGKFPWCIKTIETRYWKVIETKTTHASSIWSQLFGLQVGD